MMNCSFPLALVLLVWSGLLLASGFGFYPINTEGPEVRMLWGRIDIYGQTWVYNTIILIMVMDNSFDPGTVNKAGTMQIL